MARWAGDGKDWITLMKRNTTSQGRCHSEFARVDETASGKEKRVQRNCADKETKRSALPHPPPLDLGASVPKTIVDWMNGHAKMKTKIGTVEKAQNLLRE